LSKSGPELHIEAADFAYIRAAVNKANSREVGGLGIIAIEDGKATVRHMRLLKQTISSGEVEWDDDAHPEYLTWLYTPAEDGGAGFEGETYGLYSWHSHGNMSVFWSGTDEDFIRRVGFTVPYIFSSVFNTKGDIKNRLDVWSEIKCEMLAESKRQQITWGHDQVNLNIIPHPDALPIADEAMEKELEIALKIDEIEKEFNAKKVELEKELKDHIDPLRLALTEIHKKLQNDVKDEVDEHFKLFVKTYYYAQGHGRNTRSAGGSTSPKQLTTGATDNQSPHRPTSPGKSTNGAKPNEKQADKGKESATSTATKERAVTDGDDITFRDTLFYRGYDTTAKVTGTFTLQQILNDDDIVLCQEVPEQVRAQLNDSEVAKLDLRKTYEEYLSELIADNRGHEYRGGYA
jgi:hypothetical protein